MLTQEQEKYVAYIVTKESLDDWFIEKDSSDNYHLVEGHKETLYDEYDVYFLGSLDSEEFIVWLTNRGEDNTWEIEDYDENEHDDYLVLTDSEADDKWEEELDNYIDDCILWQLPERLRFYFDSEKWKDDARKDGRGCSISKYDGDEHKVTVEETTYYVYRQD